MSDEHSNESVTVGRSNLNSVSLPTKFRDAGLLDFGREDILGFIWDGKFFEFKDGHFVEVEGWSGDLGNGWSYKFTSSDACEVCGEPHPAYEEDKI